MSLEVDSVRLALYGKAGASKTTTGLSMLKALKDGKIDKFFFFALEGTADRAIKNAFRVWDLYDLPEDKFIYCKPEAGTIIGDFATGNATEMDNIWNMLRKPTGVSVTWDKEANKITLGTKKVYPPISDTKVFNESVWVQLDGFSSLVASAGKKGKAMCSANELKDGRAPAFKEQGVILWTMSEIFAKTQANLIVTMHELVYVPATDSNGNVVENKKHKGHKDINPFVGSKSITERVLGGFTDIFYVFSDDLANRRYISMVEPNIWTRTSVDKVAFEEMATKYNNELRAKGISNQSLHLKLNNLPQDLTHECYDFLK